jgi:hypothetical protein
MSAAEFFVFYIIDGLFIFVKFFLKNFFHKIWLKTARNTRNARASVLVRASRRRVSS